MAANSSEPAGQSSARKINSRVILVQVLVLVFLCINFLLIVTFSMRHFFYTTMRYILFAVTLLSDSVLLLLTDIMLILSYFAVAIEMWVCVTIYVVLALYTFVTPVTLTVMTLERYVAICLPLRHSELCSMRRALHCILLVHGVSFLPCAVVLSMLFASASYNFYTQVKICSAEILIIHQWQSHLRSAISQFYFLIMCVVILLSYIKVMKVAKAASGENKKSTWKGLRTVILHAFQLLLSLIQLWCPFIESAIFQIDYMLFINVRYFNYVTFILAPRCLSPLIYGLRDEKFFNALKYLALCGLYKKRLDLFDE
ncbi:odorant receptor 131-2-like [Takifugu flavidus]|uniref:odorant receptor 131-2-like n=1 Tax=Takifugu flavidus TaxID=433684 RepID=UPI00254418B1|nr:odorant receptor 131-2-like [Takifugu flavidus]